MAGLGWVAWTILERGLNQSSCCIFFLRQVEMSKILLL